MLTARSPPRVPELETRQRVQLKRSAVPSTRLPSSGRTAGPGRAGASASGASRARSRRGGAEPERGAPRPGRPAVGADQVRRSGLRRRALSMPQAQRRRQDPGPGQPAGLAGRRSEAAAGRRVTLPKRLGNGPANVPRRRAWPKIRWRDSRTVPFRTEQVDAGHRDRYPGPAGSRRRHPRRQNVAPVGTGGLPASANRHDRAFGGRIRSTWQGAGQGAARRRPGRRAPRSPAIGAASAVGPATRTLPRSGSASAGRRNRTAPRSSRRGRTARVSCRSNGRLGSGSSR